MSEKPDPKPEPQSPPKPPPPPFKPNPSLIGHMERGQRRGVTRTNPPQRDSR